MVRVYQLAKQLNITSKRVLEVAEILGINVKAHQSSLSEEDVSKIIKYLKKNRRIGIVFNKTVLTLIDFIKEAFKKRTFATGFLLGLTAFTIFGFSISNANDSVAEVEIIDTVEQIDVLTTTPTELIDQEGSSPPLFTDSDDSTTSTTVPVTTTTTTVPVTTTSTTVPVTTTTTTTTVPVTTTTTTTTIPVTCDDESFSAYTLYKTTGEGNTVMSCRNEQEALESGYVLTVNPNPSPTQIVPVSTNYTFDTDWQPHTSTNESEAVVDIDSNNNLYVTGANNASYAMTIGTQQIDPKDFFVYKLNQLGDLEWIKVFGNSPSEGAAYDIAVDNNGNSIITGYFSGSIDFGTGIQTATGSYTTFILKLDSNGETEWVVIPTSSDVSYDFGSGVDTDANGNIYVSGLVNHKTTNTVTSLTFGSFTISNVNYATGFYLKINSSGVVQWVKTINSRGGGSIFVDSQDNKYLSGKCMGQGASGSMYSSRGPAPFSNVDGDDIVTLNCATYLDVFVIKLDSSDDYVWHWKDWGAEKGGGVQIIANNNGDVFVTYYINGAQPEICGSSTTTVGGSEVYVLVKLDSTGTCQWFYKSEDLLIDSNWTNRLGVDSNNNIYMNTVAYTYNPIGYYNYSFSILVINDQGVQQNSLSWNTRTYDLVFDTDDNIYLNRIVGITKSSLADLE